MHIMLLRAMPITMGHFSSHIVLVIILITYLLAEEKTRFFKRRNLLWDAAVQLFHLIIHLIS